MEDWLGASFGPTLCDLFFYPFHKLYTAGLWDRIGPQDSYKSPVNLALATQGAFGEAPPVGYNVTFVYPTEGLNTVAQRMAARCDVRYERRVVRIDVENRVVLFQDDSTARYDTLVSTLPLDFMIDVTGLELDEPPNPSPSVLVVNVGATKGPRCPTEHWVYVPESRAGFHRVGFYSNVDRSFLPAPTRAQETHVSIYVEKAYAPRQRPDPAALAAVCHDVVSELREWAWIGDVEAVDPTWIDVAYTWSWPGSGWTAKAIRALEAQGIYQVGRFARWTFQGIADSIRDGLMAQGAIRRASPA
jgi:protoporphyrinogen oxidase